MPLFKQRNYGVKPSIKLQMDFQLTIIIKYLYKHFHFCLGTTDLSLGNLLSNHQTKDATSEIFSHLCVCMCKSKADTAQ